MTSPLAWTTLIRAEAFGVNRTLSLSDDPPKALDVGYIPANRVPEKAHLSWGVIIFC